MTHALRQISPRRVLLVATVLAALAAVIVVLLRPGPAKAVAASAVQHRGCSVRTLLGRYGGDLVGTSTSTGPTAGQVLETF